MATSKLIEESATSGHPTKSSRVYARLRETTLVVLRHASKHTGVGIICSVAYFDPGNWGVDLQAGSEFGYKLLFVVLLAGLIAVYMQVLASRLGCVTGLDLAAHCRILLHSRPKHTLLWRWLALYPLYVLAEVAIIATDLAELLGSAIALTLLFPGLPLWGGVLLTGADVLVLLAVRNPLDGQPIKPFEIIIAVLVFTVLICMAVIISKAGVHWGDAFDGFVPSKVLVSSEGLYTAVGILGATVMPHSLFLGSAFATQERELPAPSSPNLDAGLSKVETMDSDASSTLNLPSSVSSDSDPWYRRFRARRIQQDVLRLTKECFAVTRTDASSTLSLPSSVSSHPDPWYRRFRVRKFRQDVWRFTKECFAVTRTDAGGEPEPKSHAERENHSLAFVRRHMNHGIVDMVVSLLGIAVVINALILMLASATFFYGSGETGTMSPATLFDAYDLLSDSLGKAAATLFALALLASGQASSIIATLAGQTVSEGFIHWRVSPMLRRLLTRCIGLVPSVTVAAALGRAGVSSLLVISQVVLSIVLPFIIFPLLYITSSRQVMSVKGPPAHSAILQATSNEPGPREPDGAQERRRGSVESESVETASESASESVEAASKSETVVSDVEAEQELVDFSNGRFTMALGWILWIIIVVANMYAIVTLAVGED